MTEFLRNLFTSYDVRNEANSNFCIGPHGVIYSCNSDSLQDLGSRLAFKEQMNIGVPSEGNSQFNFPQPRFRVIGYRD